MIKKLTNWLSLVRVIRITLAVAIGIQAFTEKQYYLLVISALLLGQGLFKKSCHPCSDNCSASKYNK